ncbi:MAG: hypothetical protein WCP06_08085 [Verrucomicrobiota bacterium]
MNTHRCTVKALATLGVLIVLLALTAWARLWNASDVFVEGKTFFMDPDCYSRMTRVEQIVEHPGTIIHRHDFENWPLGTQPHTTAPFDYLTAALAVALRPVAPPSPTALDLAGAFISPLLGLATALFAWIWAGRLKLPFRVPMIVLLATSSILIHGTALGRPDHQSLLILCMAVALGAEAALFAKPSRGWAVVGGVAWGLGLWVSLYEPLALLLAVFLIGLVFNRKSLVAPERRPGWLAMIFVLLIAACVDGWRMPVIDPVLRDYFGNWSLTIGELNRTGLGTLVGWCGYLLIAAPLLLVARVKKDRVAGFWLCLLSLTAGLSLWQARWGYFLALVFALALPTMLQAFPKRWVALVVFALALYPIAREGRQRIAPDENEAGLRMERRQDALALFDVAQQLRGAHRLPVLAPWWQSPALAYWSGQPCVAGSSHESLSGTVASARFFLSTDPTAAADVLIQRKVACVVAYDPTRVLTTSNTILHPSAPLKDPEGTMAYLLYTHREVPPFLKFAYSNAAFRVFLRPDGL